VTCKAANYKKEEHPFNNITENKPALKECLEYNKIPNCKEHQHAMSINGLSFKCTKCDDLYFL